MMLRDASAIVTGAASGLGRATAQRLLASGVSVVLVDLPDRGGEDVAAELGGAASFVAADVADDDQVAAAVSRAAAVGDLRVVVNCAGIVSPGKVLGRKGVLPSSAFGTVLRVNLLGTFNVVRLAAERMAQTEPVDGERGVIVNTASVAAFDGQIGQAAYAASKGGVAAMTLPLARELADHLIRVVSIAPGTFETPMMASLPDETRRGLAANVPHPKRFGRPGEFAALVHHIVENPMLNGEVIRLDGAIRMPAR
ncbi:SDR family NAD(P)-dependent oxidoreductase [Mycobacterium sp. NAZ190054]|uniref:SDR family NAD(P)-dependent oxidoreductase n=1 Tax=Mycobacterium sp. NAZ190054 TaxID=1747766 RepID=UPI00079552C6|nr:SDR family NAD(P)-dependent oxidoreductase [Mycobacterium sp. NAZ190054]KWX68404.1 3-hydroxy-2-methylbutyryl-CoA dehydrogenase [Mycobacterium sp. NAZ190054]